MIRYNRMARKGEWYSISVDGVKVGTIAKNGNGEYTIDLPNHKTTETRSTLEWAKLFVKIFFKD